VGIGVVPEAWTVFDGVLQIGSGGAVASTAAITRLSNNIYYDGAYKRIATGTAASYIQNSGIHIWTSDVSGTGDVGFTPTEAMRIDASGNLLVARTTDNNAVAGVTLSNVGIVKATRTDWSLLLNRIGSTSGSLALFQYDGGTVGSISVTASATAYNTSSDQRLKENIADADDAGSKIDAIQVRKFDWKADGSHQDYGMVAQELLEVAPEAVSAPEDPEEMMGVDYSKLVPMMLKEIQSLRARVATLEGNPPQETTTTERVII
jgi:hypothetical protein